MMAHADRYSMAFSAAKYQDLLDGKIPQSEMWKYSSFWYKDFDAMAYKTMLRQLISKWGVMSIDLQKAYANDTTVTYGDGSVEYVDTSADFSQTIAAPVAALGDAGQAEQPQDVVPPEKQNNRPQASGGGGSTRQVSMNDL